MKTVAWTLGVLFLLAFAVLLAVGPDGGACTAGPLCGAGALLAWAYLAITDHMEHRR